MKYITLSELNKIKKVRCDKGKHKYRENKFGVTWCVLCGLLGGYNTPAEKLEEEDKLLIIND